MVYVKLMLQRKVIAIGPRQINVVKKGDCNGPRQIYVKGK